MGKAILIYLVCFSFLFQISIQEAHGKEKKNNKKIHIPAELNAQIEFAAKRVFIDPDIIRAMAFEESKYQSYSLSHKGAQGLMQVIQKTGSKIGIKHPYHPMDNLIGACEYMRNLLNQFQGNLIHALAAYNAGPMAVRKYKGIPPYKETKNYVKRILNIYNRLKKYK